MRTELVPESSHKPAASGTESFDIFVSYSRADNANALIARFVECLRREVEQFLDRPLRPFFDIHAIEGMDDWQHRILEGLRQSRVFVASVSPAFLASAYCEWESPYVESTKWAAG